MQFPVDPKEPPSQEAVEITIAFLYETSNSFEDIRFEFTYALRDEEDNRISHSSQITRNNSCSTANKTYGAYDQFCDYFCLASNYPLRFFHPTEIRPKQGYSNENNLGHLDRRRVIWDAFT